MKNKYVQVVVLVVLALIAFGAIYAAGVESNLEPGLSQTAKENTFRNTFISGCTQEGATQSECGCAYNELDKMYYDFATNDTRINRIIESGYNLSETDAIVKCADYDGSRGTGAPAGPSVN